MSEGLSAERLAELERRWEADPSSRAFVQLAEEYRRTGELSRAAGVLQKGLESHPHYLSALVALGRCRFELGDAAGAIDVLGRALAQDPTQLVANKLLVEAYLANGQPESAGERLDFYRLFNDHDEEIDALQGRIDAALSAAAETARPRDVFELERPNDLRPIDLSAPPAAAAPVAPTPGRPAGEPFGALHDAASAGRRLSAALASGGVFAVEPPPAEAAPAPRRPLSPAVKSAPAGAKPAAAEEPPPPPPWGRATRAPELEHDSVQQVVAEPFRPRTIGEEVERETIEEPFDEVLQARSVGPREPLRAAPASSAPAEPIAPESEAQAPEEAEEDAWAILEAGSEGEEPGGEAADGEAEPSSTLGELYLSQGHLEEAEAEFRRVLATRPDDPVAGAGIVEIERRRAGLEETASGWAADAAEAEADTAAAEAGEPAAGRPAPGGLTDRKVATLRSFLRRIRRGNEDAHVP